jgi:hypothetical protein
MDGGQHRAGRSQFGQLGASQQACIDEEVPRKEEKLHSHSTEFGAARNDGTVNCLRLGFRTSLGKTRMKGREAEDEDKCQYWQ